MQWIGCWRWIRAPADACFVQSVKHDKLDFCTLLWKRTSNPYNISSFWICSIKADKCLRTYYKLSWKYVNTAEIISKVTITLSLISSNKYFDFVGWVMKTSYIFYFRTVKFHYMKETYDINSLLTLVKVVLASQRKRQPNKSFSRFVGNWKHRLGLESARAALCKWATCTYQTCFSKTFANSPNKQKQWESLQKRVLVMIKGERKPRSRILYESLKLLK